MALLLFAVLLFAVTIALAKSRPDATDRRPLLTAFNLVLLLFIVYIVFPAGLIIANNYQYVWAPDYGGTQALAGALQIGSAALLIFLASYYFFSQGPRATRAGTAQRASHSTGRPTSGAEPTVVLHIQVVTAWVLVTIGVLLKLYLLYSNGGLHAATVRLSGSARLITGTSALNSSAIGLRTLSGVADAGMTWLVVDALARGGRVMPRAAIWSIVLALSYITLGKRLALLLPIIAVGLAFHRYRRPLTVKLMPFLFLAGLAFGMVTLLARVFFPASAAGVQINLNTVAYSQGSILSFYLYSLEFSAVEMLTVVTHDPASIVAPFGGAAHYFIETNLVPFLYAIPHQIFPAKPTLFYDTSYAVSSVLTGTPIQNSTVGYISTIIGVGYSNSGYFGLIIYMVSIGYAAARVDRVIANRRMTASSTIMCAVLLNLIFHFFRQGNVGWVFVIGIVEQLGFLSGIAVIVAAGRLAKPPPAPGVAVKPETLSAPGA